MIQNDCIVPGNFLPALQRGGTMATRRSHTRKDPNGHVLRKGEGYRKDKQRYIFQYTDNDRHHVTIYADTLEELRKKEDQITADRVDNIHSYAAGKVDLNYAFDRYMSLKYYLRPTTKAGYLYTYDHFVRDTFGKTLIKDIRYTDVKRFYCGLLAEKGIKPLTLDNINTVIHPTLGMAVRDGIIRYNPSTGVMAEIRKSNLWDRGTGVRHALTADQGKAFLGYVQRSETYNHWFPMFIVFFGTGMRVGEVCALTWDDISFEKKEIHVTHAVAALRDPVGYQLHIGSPKTESGKRTIPMMDEVYEALKVEYERQSMVGFSTYTVDGVTGFVFLNAYGRLHYQHSVNKAISRITEEYNSKEILQAAKENRKPLLLPHFTCHHIRHTFCTRMCENEANIKAIQDIMGHSDIQTTLNIYAEATDKVKQEAIQSLQKGWDIF